METIKQNCNLVEVKADLLSGESEELKKNDQSDKNRKKRGENEEFENNADLSDLSDCEENVVPEDVFEDAEKYYPKRFYQSNKYYLINKPTGYLSTKEKDINIKTVYTYAESFGIDIENLGLIGRLDKETSGIIILSNDSRLNRALTFPPKGSFEKINAFKKKQYILTLTSHTLYKLNDFFQLEEEMSQPFSFSKGGVMKYTTKAEVKVVRKWQEEAKSHGHKEYGWFMDVSVIINEGKHHQVRRIAKRSHFRIVGLKRVKMAEILTLDSLTETSLPFRELTYEEVRDIYKGLRITFNQTNVCGQYIGDKFDSIKKLEEDKA